MIKALICAVRFLTILPFGKSLNSTSKDLARSMAFYPVIGYGIGLLMLGFYSLVSHGVAPIFAVVFTFLIGIILTGALHLDGFADTCDGFYGGKSKDEILAIMRDSHIGAMATGGLFCLLVLKLSLFLSLYTRGILNVALLLTPALGRWAMVVATSLYPYARTEEGLAKPFIEEISWKEGVIATVVLLVLVYGQMKQPGALLVLNVLIVVMLVSRWISKKIGGMTGDTLGAINELAEVACLILLHWYIPIAKEVWTI